MVRLIRWLLVALCLAAGPAAAQTTCGTLSNCATASTPLGGAELMYIVQGGVSKKIASGTFLGQAAGVVLPLAATTKLYGGSGIAGTAAVVSVGTGLTLSAGTLSVNTAQSLATLSVSGSTTLAAVSATSLSVSGTSTLAATNITGAMTFNGSLTDTPTHQFYTSGGANIQRLSDRVLVGGAVNGGYAGTSTSNTDWWDTVESSLHGSTVGADAVYAQFVSTFDNASVNGGLAVPQIAIAGASTGSRTKCAPGTRWRRRGLPTPLRAPGSSVRNSVAAPGARPLIAAPPPCTYLPTRIHLASGCCS